jgi:hypothetical protein
MHDPVRFTIVTNDAERALAESFGCAPSNRPDFVRIVTDPIAIDRLRDGSKVYGLFYCSRRAPSAAYSAFLDRRCMGGLVWLDDDDYDYVRDWVKLHKRAVEERALRLPAEPREPAIEPEDSVIARPAPEIEKLVLSQRWT